MEFLELTPEQEKVYFTLLSLGQSSAGELVKVIGISIDKLQQLLKELEAKQFVMPVKGIGNRYVAIYPFKLLSERTFGSARKLGEAINELNERISKHLARINETTEQQQEQLITIVNQTLEENENALLKTKESLQQTFEEQQGALTSKKGEITSRIQHFKEDAEKDSKQAREKMKEVIERMNALKHEKSEETSRSLLEQSKDPIDEFKKAVPEVLNEVLRQVDDSLSTSETQVTEASEKLLKMTSELSTMSLKLVEDQLSGIMQEADTQLNIAGQSLETQATQFSGMITNKSQNLERVLKEALGAFKQNASNTATRLSNDWISIIKQKNQSHQQAMNQQLAELERTVQAKFNELRVQLTKFTADLEQLVVEQVKQATQQTITQANQMETEFIDNIAKGKEALIDNVSSTVDSSLENVTALVASFQKDWSQAMEQWKNVLTSVKQDVIKKANDQLDARKIVAKNDISAFQTQTTSEINNILQEAKSKLNELKIRAKQFKQQGTSELDKLIMNFEENIQQLANATSSAIQSVIQVAMEQFQENTTSLIENFDSQVNSLTTIHLDPISGDFEELTRTLSTTKESFERLQDAMASRTKETLQKLSESLQASLGNQLGELSQQLSEFTSYFENGVNQITTVLNATFQSLTDLDSKFQTFERPSISTTPLLGKDAIMEHILGMLDRVPFSRMTLLVPNIHDLPVEKIIVHKKARFIRLYTYANPNADRELLQKLIKAGVQIFKIPDNDEKWKGNIVTEAGDAEAVWAVYDPINPDDALGLASSNAAFISVVVGLVLQSLLTYREQVREQDVGL